MLKLRSYQQELLNAVRAEAVAGKKKIIMVLSTGGGKTAILFEIARLAVKKGGKVLMLVHRRDLAFQTSDKFREYGINAGIIMSGVDSELSKPVQVASVWTYKNRLDLDVLEFNQFFINASLVLVDECHKSLSPTFKKVLKHYDDKIVIGVTATPCLGSGAAMGSVYDSLVDVVPITRLIDEKYLVPCVYYGGSAADMTGVKTVKGDFDIKELGKRSDQPKLIGDIVENWFRIASDKQTIVFSVNRSHGKHLLNAFQKKGIAVEYLDAHSPDEQRLDVLEAFAKKEIQMIINVALFQEFLDAPITGCVVMGRSTKSLGLWRQCIGRGLRPHKESGKTELIVLDHGGCCQRLGFADEVVEWTLEGKKAYKKKKPKKKEKPLFECEMCRFMHRQERCPQCGWKIQQYGKKVEAYEAELKELKKPKAKKTYTMEDKRNWYGMLETERIAKGYKPGWTAQNYRKKFQVWPKGMDDVVAASQSHEFKNWLTYQRIKYFKSKKAQEVTA